MGRHVFNAVFGDDIWFLAELTAVAAVLGLLAWDVARRRRIARAGWWAPLVFCLTGVLGVTLALRGGTTGRAECVVNHDLTEPLYTTQGLWNLAMFVPLGLFGVLALRRPLPALAGVLALPVLIELTQALAPFVSGICDSADVEMNAGGGALGVAAGLVLLRGRVAWRAWAAPTAAVTAVFAVLGAVVCRTVVTLNHMDGSTVRDARGDERVAAERAVHQAFGDRYRVGAVRISPGLDGYNGWMNIQFAGGFPAELMWPGGRRLNVDFGNTAGMGSMEKVGYLVPGAGTPHGTADAYRIARTYMRAHYAWAESASWHATRAVHDSAGSGWVTSWRFKERGVEMPRSLDVRINPAGRVYGMQVDLGPTHVPLPAKLISARRGEEIVREERRKIRADTAGLRIEVGPLTTERTMGHTGPWRAVWSVVVTDTRCTPDADGYGCEPMTVSLDAATGESAD
ncbi:VanZ family protein [Streptomyces hirsutus]|uniref:VanZ family protein n=1 Tax=Streptomyces hirsutus TaxID=35620 RepID=UPI0036341A0E